MFLTCIDVREDNYHVLCQSVFNHVLDDYMGAVAVHHGCLVAEYSVKNVKNRIALILIISDGENYVYGSVLLAGC